MSILYITNIEMKYLLIYFSWMLILIIYQSSLLDFWTVWVLVKSGLNFPVGWTEMNPLGDNGYKYPAPKSGKIRFSFQLEGKWRDLRWKRIMLVYFKHRYPQSAAAILGVLCPPPHFLAVWGPTVVDRPHFLLPCCCISSVFSAAAALCLEPHLLVFKVIH